MTSQVTRETIDLNSLLARAKNSAAGAVLLFSGDVRNHSEGRAVDFLEYETHESMAQKQIAEIVVEAKNRWDLHYVEVIHRFGKMQISDCSIGNNIEMSIWNHSIQLDFCKELTFYKFKKKNTI